MDASRNVEVMAEAVFKVLTQYVDKKMATLAARIDKIETKGVVFRGIYNQSEEYTRGDLVSQGGSIFHCVRDTQGISPAHADNTQKAVDFPWQVACRRGRDGKDFVR
jgi:hypothetical protein